MQCITLAAEIKNLDRNGILIEFGNVTWQGQECVVQNGSKNAKQT